MKPAAPERNIPKLRPLRSLYVQNTKPGKLEANPTKLAMRKTMFKPPSGNMKFKSNLGQAKTILRRTPTGINRKESMRMSRAVNTIAGIQQCPQMSGYFVRPSIDIRSFRQQMMERNKRIGDLLKTDEVGSKVINLGLIKSPTVPVTPKQSGLSMAYLKLSDFKNKSRNAVPSTPTSPFVKGIIQKKTNDDIGKVTNMKQEKNVNISTVSDSISSANVKVVNQDNKENAVKISGKDDITTGFSLNAEEKSVDIVTDENDSNCALSNILKHYQFYNNNMLSLNKEMDALDDKFRSVIFGEIGSQVHAKFSEYQKQKKQLFRKMESLEEELEKSMMNELDVASKFKEYLTKKRNFLKERTNVQQNFEKLLKQTIQKYEEEMSKPARSEKVDDILKSLTRGKTECAQPVLRRSKRLMGTPNVGNDEGKSPGRILRRSSAKKREELKKSEDDSLIVRRGQRSMDKKRIQSCMYKDLQKSFNLCSPECSF